VIQTIEAEQLLQVEFRCTQPSLLLQSTKTFKGIPLVVEGINILRSELKGIITSADGQAVAVHCLLMLRQP